MSDIFQVMPPLSDEEYAALKADIAERGMLVPVVKDQDGRIIDGHHRIRIAAELGIDYPVEVRKVADDDQARDIAFALNVARRHLTREQKRELIAKEITARPDDSDRAIGRRLGCDHKTVGAVRRELSGEIPHPAPLTPAQRLQANLLFELMKQRTISAAMMKRNGDNIIAWMLHKHDDGDDPAVLAVAWPRYAQWANSAPETRGVLWTCGCGDDWDPEYCECRPAAAQGGGRR